MEANKNSSPIVTELFLKDRKLNSSLVSISQSYFKELIKRNTLFYHENT